MGESKIFRRDVGNLSMLSISAIFHNTNDANDDRSQSHKAIKFPISLLEVFSGIPVLLGMSISRHSSSDLPL